MKRKKTKKALSGSVLALVLCFVMLIGTTFAWFTSSDSTAVNKIEAGTLEVDIVDASGNTLNGQSLAWQKAEGASENEATLWEPGVTYKSVGFKIKNNGNLALKYKFALNGVKGDSKLLEVIDFSVVKADGTAVELGSFEGKLTAGNTASDVLYIQGNMKKEAGNAYQGLTLEGIGITVYAAQDTVEWDSTTNQYDEEAAYEAVVSTAEEFRTAVTSGKSVVLTSDIALTGAVTTKDNVTIDGNGHTISGAPIWCGDNVVVKNLTIEAPVNSENNASCLYAGGSITLDGCTFKDFQWDGVQLTPNAGDVIVVNNCTFETTKAAQRFLHIEASPTFTENDVSITLTNNHFGNSTTLTNSEIDLDFVKLESIDFGGNNTFADASSATDIYVCATTYGRTISSGDAYTAMTTGD